MKKRIGLFFIAVIVIATTLISQITVASERFQKPLMSATEYDYPPFSVTDAGVADGFSVELLKAVAQEIGMDIDFRIDTWISLKDELEAGELDVLPLVGYNEEREKYFDFSVPYIIVRGNIFVRSEDVGVIQSEEDIYGKSLIVMRGDNAHEYAVNKGWSDDLILTDTYTEAFELLSSGEYDAVIAQSLVGEKLINELNLKNVEPLYIYDEDGVTKARMQLTDFEQKFCFAVKEGDAVLLARLNEGLAIVSENGIYDELYTKWFPFLVEKPSAMDIFRSSVIVLAPVLLVLLIISILIIRKQVKDKTAVLEMHNEKIRYLSLHDQLTGLPNRRCFEQELDRLDHQEYYPLMLLVADLNGLKMVNDAFGHLVGDNMIKTAAGALKKACKDTDVVTRWGGDEFVCILPNADEAYVHGLINNINDILEGIHEDYGQISLSFGHEAKNHSDISVIELFERAEEYMYKNKMMNSEGVRGHMIKTMLNTLFEKSPTDKDHSDRVSVYATKLARAMNLKSSVVSDITTIGLLHDIGKIVVPQSILDKLTKLDVEEWEQIKQHPLIGYRIFCISDEYAHIAKGVLHHHERLDGKGYPEGIKGDAIPIESKVISVADAFDAMTAYRPYKKKVLSEKEAAVELKNNIDTQFDADIVKIFVSDVLNLKWDEI